MSILCWSRWYKMSTSTIVSCIFTVPFWKQIQSSIGTTFTTMWWCGFLCKLILGTTVPAIFFMLQPVLTLWRLGPVISYKELLAYGTLCYSRASSSSYVSPLTLQSHQSPLPSIQYPTPSTHPCIIIPWPHFLQTSVIIHPSHLMLYSQDNTSTRFPFLIWPYTYHISFVFCSTSLAFCITLTVTDVTPMPCVSFLLLALWACIYLSHDMNTHTAYDTSQQSALDI